MEHSEYRGEIKEKKMEGRRGLFSNTVEDYLEGIGKTPLLSREEERELAKRIKKGKDKSIKLFKEAICLIKKDSELFTLFEKTEKEREILDNPRESLDEVREVFDYLRRKKKEINQTPFSHFLSKIQPY